VLKLTKLTGEQLFLSAEAITEIEREGSVTRIRTRWGREYLVMDLPEDIYKQIQELKSPPAAELPGRPSPPAELTGRSLTEIPLR